MSEEQGELYYLALEDLNVVVTSGGGYIVDLELVSGRRRAREGERDRGGGKEMHSNIWGAGVNLDMEMPRT